MPEQKVFELSIALGIFSILLFVFILLLSPVIALLYLAVLMLAITLLWFCCPPFRDPIRNRLDATKQKIKGTVDKQKESGVKPLDTEFHPEYELVLKQYGSKEKYLISKEEFLIGRGNECDLRINGNRAVSHKHCRIVYRRFSHEYYIEDLHSAGGTYVGARRLEPYKQEKLLPNTDITISGWVYAFTKRL